jgi:hypothetical protein
VSGEVVDALGLPSSEPFNRRGERWLLDRLVEQAARRITRLDAPDAFSASTADGVIIDICSQDACELSGFISGSFHIPRTVHEWRIAVDGLADCRQSSGATD